MTATGYTGDAKVLVNQIIRRHGDETVRYETKLTAASAEINERLYLPTDEDQVNTWLGNYIELGRLPFEDVRDRT